MHDTIKGKVIAIDRNEIIIEDEDGFERVYHPSKLALLTSSDHYKLGKVQSKDTIGVKIFKKTVVESTYEIDLHIEELIDNHNGMTNHDILQKQMMACRSFVQKAIQQHKKEIVIIHGKGEGVLKSEIHLYLNRISNESGIKLEYVDASYQNYGIGGATKVIFY